MRRASPGTASRVPTEPEPLPEDEGTGAGTGVSVDVTSFEDLYRENWAPMVRLGWLLSGNREVAEDVVHDSFLRLEPKWDDIRDPRSYLRRSVVNAVAAHHRHSQVEARHRPSGAPYAFNPEFEEVWAIVANLPHRQRHALVLRFYLDLTVEGVADYLHCPVGTAKSLIHRGIAQIRERVQ